jgi:hypothetical protein
MVSGGRRPFEVREPLPSQNYLCHGLHPSRSASWADILMWDLEVFGGWSWQLSH